MYPSPLFQIGQRVDRIEDRPVVGAVVLNFEFFEMISGYIYTIEYDEGGQGSWPENCLKAA